MSSASDPNASDCSEVLHRVYEYLDGEMTSDDTAKIKQHLDACGPCLKEYDLDQALKALVKRSCACEEAPVELRTQIMARITTIQVRLTD
ncbi:mycothiol system anti-sigma-R factor [Pedococcus sp.]|jgi:mycothiol system anti-sigma-R factor|uniref:mycothiol system anti-sigma-R factor n=1 Tax=Pedococcus sp. TaxID=2860345 RepID=UPI002E101898|nr:mycothiol system anti-sigma-R factor [Pedococcus sp.]